MKYMNSSDVPPDGFGDDPMAAVGNLFDIALVFIVALLFALMAAFGHEVFQRREAGKKRPGELEIVVRQGKEVKHLRQSNEKAEGRGVRLGVAYQLEDGSTIYVPEGE